MEVEADLSLLGTAESVLAGTDIGGAAGFSRAVIRDCFVKSSLSGGDYIGGIIGSGKESSVVTGCVTLVDIKEFGRYCGAVSGTETGEFSENHYVSDTLAGLGRISYEGKAEPMSFYELSRLDGIPKEMTQFTLSFVIDDEKVKTLPFSYGDSFEDDILPDIPAKEGYYSYWDSNDLTDLRFDKTVTAEYSRYVLTIPSEETRSRGSPVFLLDGNFDDEDLLTADKIEETDIINGKRASEQWKIKCSDMSQESYTVRFLSADETAKGFSVYVKQDENWEKIESEAFGSYLMFSVPKGEAEIAVIYSGYKLAVVIIAAASVVIAAAIIIFVKKLRKNKSADGTLKEQKN